MSKPLTKQIIDHSDEKSFSFSFFCDICGKEWKSPTVPFETGGITIEHEEAQMLLWTKEHSAAFEQANLEAHMQFNGCQRCGKRVCDGCFNITGENTGLCRECEENPHPCGFSSLTNVSHSSAKVQSQGIALETAAKGRPLSRSIQKPKAREK
jgi:hypothetical protein